MNGEVTATLESYCPGPAGRGCTFRVVAIPGGFLLGVAIPGHGDIRGGVLPAAELLALGKQLMDMAIGGIKSDWQAVQQYTVPASRTVE
jgi:hypothetical protein